MLRGLKASEADAQEIAQETWVRVFKNRDRYDPARPFGPFLYTIAKHLWSDRLRSQQVRQKGDYLHWQGHHAPELDDPEVEQWELAHQYVQRIDHCLGELKTQDRRILGLRYHDNWTNRQIAELLTDTESQVKHRVYKVVHLLKDCVNADPELPSDDILNKILAVLTTSELVANAAARLEAGG
jgi:RNA polymerase sigma-70 factor (ECF subfamily)